MMQKFAFKKLALSITCIPFDLELTFAQFSGADSLNNCCSCNFVLLILALLS